MDARYEQWMILSGADPATVRTSLSTVRRIEMACGDVDEHFDKDRCESLLSEFAYSSNDVRTQKPNPSRIVINGDLYNSLASIRTHLAKYVRFRSEVSAVDPDEPPNSASQMVATSSDLTFSLERDLQVALRRSIEQLEPGLEIIDGGGEYVLPSGRVDILARDRDGARVVIELKAVKATRDSVGQTLAYMGDLASEGSSEVRGILVAPDFDPRAEAAARVVPTLMLVRYGFTFTFSPLG